MTFSSFDRRVDAVPARFRDKTDPALSRMLLMPHGLEPC